MNHRDEAERILELTPWTDTSALAHAVLALIDSFDDLVIGFEMVEPEEYEEDEDE